MKDEVIIQFLSDYKELLEIARNISYGETGTPYFELQEFLDKLEKIE